MTDWLNANATMAEVEGRGQSSHGTDTHSLEIGNGGASDCAHARAAVDTLSSKLSIASVAMQIMAERSKFSVFCFSIFVYSIVAGVLRDGM